MSAKAADEPLTKRKQSIEDICRQLGHYSKVGRMSYSVEFPLLKIQLTK